MDKKGYELPSKALIYKGGYVYINIERNYIKDRQNANFKRCSIGKMIDGIFIPNRTYFEIYPDNSLQEAPERSDALSFGVKATMNKLSKMFRLDNAMNAFEEEDKFVLLDLALYMMQENSSVFQHFPRYAYKNDIFSRDVKDDSYISKFLSSEAITDTKVDYFLDNWMKSFKDSSELYICYDSTNINSEAEGVSLNEFGQAKDDDTKPQINIEYAVRQKDGIPILYKVFHGSIIDLVECPDMIDRLKRGKNNKISIVVDRGYVSRQNIKYFDENNFNFILLLKDAFEDVKELINTYKDEVKEKSDSYIPEYDVYGKTYEYDVFKLSKGRYCHIIYNPEKARLKQKELFRNIKNYEIEMDRYIEKKSPINDAQKKRLERYFEIEYYSTKGKNIIKRYTSKKEEINKELSKKGFMVIVTSKKMEVKEAMDNYFKRDSVEKTFRVLKSEFGLDKLGVHSDNAVKAKLLVAFIASILRALLYLKTQELRKEDRKNFTFNAMINELEKIEATKDFKTGKRYLRYKLTKKQKDILDLVGINEDDLVKIATTI